MPERFVPLVGAQRAALLGLLTTLPPDDWTRPTAVRAWPVHDVVAHLVEGELLFGRVYRGERNGISYEDAEPHAGIERWRQADGETLRFSLWHHGSAVQRVIDSRSDESWRRDVTLFDRPLQLRHVLRLHFFDLAVHSYDLSAALGVPSLWEDRVPFIVEYSVRRAPDLLTAAGARSEAGIRVGVPGVGSWTLEHPEGSWRVSEAREQTAAVWETDPETLVLATTGRLAVGEALARSTVEGDAGLLGDVVAAWQVKSA